MTQGLDITADTHRANAALEDVLGVLARAPRLSDASSTAIRLREQQALTRLARRFQVEEPELRERLASLRRRPSSSNARRSALASAPLDDAPAVRWEDLELWDRELLEAILQYPEGVGEAAQAIDPDELTTPIARAIYAKCLTCHAAGIAADFDRLMLEAERSSTRSLLVELDEHARAKSRLEPSLHFQEVLAGFRRRKEEQAKRQAIAALAAAPVEANQSAEAAQAWIDMVNRLKARQGKSAPTDG